MTSKQKIAVASVDIKFPDTLSGSPPEVGGEMVVSFIVPLLDKAAEAMDKRGLLDMYIGMGVALASHCRLQLGVAGQKALLHQLATTPEDVYESYKVYVNGKNE